MLEGGTGRRPVGRRARRVLLALCLVLLMAPAASVASAPRLHDLARSRLDLASAGPAARAAALGSVLPAADRSSRRGALRALAARTRPARVVVGLRRPGDVADAARDLRGAGSAVDPLPAVSAVAVSTRSPQDLAAELADRPDVAYVEPVENREWLADPADGVDPETGIPYGWGFGIGSGFLGVNAAPAIAAAGGGSDYQVAVLDSGFDSGHPDLFRNVASAHDEVDGSPDTADPVGHGTFVAGLVGAEGDNGIGLRGTAGNTRVLGVRIGDARGVTSTRAAAGIVWAVDHGARVLNMSFGSADPTQIEERALDYAFINDVLPVAAAGNAAQEGNPLVFPAAQIGGDRGETGIGLSVAATKPSGDHAEFSSHNEGVSVAGPGSAPNPADCRHGVLSTIPRSGSDLWDPSSSCTNMPFGSGEPYTYGEGTSFATPLVAGMASALWEANRSLDSDQVADVINRSARQTRGATGFTGAAGWNEFTGHGVADGGAAVELARRYDTVAPRASMKTRRLPRNRVKATAKGKDRTEPGDELAGKVDVTFYTSPNGREYSRAGRPRARQATRTFKIPRRKRLWIQTLICDGNLNCVLRTKGPFRARR